MDLTKNICSWFLLVLLTVFVSGSDTEGSASTIGTQFSVIWDNNGTLYVSATLVCIEGTFQFNSLISNDSFPYEACGDRLWRCGVEVVKQNSEAITLVPQTNGIGLFRYSELNSNNFSFEEDYLVRPQENINCSFASFTRSDNRIYISCLCFYHEPCFIPNNPDYEVNVWLFELTINFNTLNESSLTLLNDETQPHYSYSTGLSRIFFYDGDNDPLDEYIVWFDDGVLFVFDLSSPHELPVEYFAENETTNTPMYECFGNNFTDVRLSSDQRRLFVYCAGNILLTVNISQRGVGYVPFDLSRTRFTCNESSYLEQRGETLAFMSLPYVDLIIPHPLNVSNSYNADCILTGNLVFFPGSSRDGTSVLTSVLENETAILATDATVDHQVIEGRLVLFTNSTGWGILDLTCPFPSIPVFTSNQTYFLSAFELDQSFVCPQEEPTGTTSEEPTRNATDVVPSSKVPSHNILVLGLSISIPVGLVMIVAAVALVIAFICIHYKKQSQPQAQRPRGSTPLQLIPTNSGNRMDCKDSEKEEETVFSEKEGEMVSSNPPNKATWGMPTLECYEPTSQDQLLSASESDKQCSEPATATVSPAAQPECDRGTSTIVQLPTSSRQKFPPFSVDKNGRNSTSPTPSHHPTCDNETEEIPQDSNKLAPNTFPVQSSQCQQAEVDLN